MKNVFLILFPFLLSFLIASDNGVFSVLSFNDAVSVSKIEGKPIFLEFRADWCHNCRNMDKTTFKDKGVLSELGRFIALQIDVDSLEGRRLAKQFNVRSVPAMFGINSEGNIKLKKIGYQSAKDLIQSLENFQ